MEEETDWTERSFNPFYTQTCSCPLKACESLHGWNQALPVWRSKVTSASNFNSPPDPSSELDLCTCILEKRTAQRQNSHSSRRVQIKDGTRNRAVPVVQSYLLHLCFIQPSLLRSYLCRVASNLLNFFFLKNSHKSAPCVMLQLLLLRANQSSQHREERRAAVGGWTEVRARRPSHQQ